jgi:hypothetical protein
MDCMTKKAWKWEPAIKLETRGHRIFRDDREAYKAPELRRWAIADDSGDYPHTTDDGVLWLDFEQPIIVTVGERLGAALPVLNEYDNTSHVVVGLKAFVTIRKHFPAWEVSLSDDAQTLLTAIELPLPQTRLKHLISHATGKALRTALASYEATGDHDHGTGSIRAGAPCGGGDDCWVRRARVTLAVIEALHSHH